jgi:RecB family exonuclease
LGDVALTGRIDRIDRFEAGRLVRDYKTGHAGLEDNVQLDTYLLAVEEPAGAVFERLKKGDAVGYVVEELAGVVRGRNVETVSREDLEERRAAMRELAEEVAGAIRAGKLAVHPRDPERCTRTQCDGFDLCRVVRARWLARPGGRS